MSRLGFFDLLTDDRLSAREASAINDAASQAETALLQGGIHSDAIGELRRQLFLQQEEIRNLRTVVTVLARVLEEAGAVDTRVLDYRVEAALDEAAEQAREQRQRETRMCVGCSLDFPVGKLNVTEYGDMCDGCLATRGG